MRYSGSLKLLEVLIEIIVEVLRDIFFGFFLFFRLDRFRPILYQLIGLILRRFNERKKFVCACLCFEGDRT